MLTPTSKQLTQEQSQQIAYRNYTVLNPPLTRTEILTLCGLVAGILACIGLVVLELN